MTVISVEHICKSYGSLNVLEDLSLELSSRSVCCLMGPSGTGKTTLLRLIMGLEAPDSGLIRFSGTKQRPRFSAVFQENRLCEAFSPEENIRLVTGRTMPPAQIRQELSIILPEESLSRPVFTLSGGMKRRTAVCRAMVAPSDVVIMDEPFTGLDEETKSQTIAYIKSRLHGRLLLLSTHQEEDVDLLGGTRILLPSVSSL